MKYMQRRAVFGFNGENRESLKECKEVVEENLEVKGPCTRHIRRVRTNHRLPGRDPVRGIISRYELDSKQTDERDR